LLFATAPILVSGKDGKIRAGRFRDLPLDVVTDLAETDLPCASRVCVAEFEVVDVARVYGEVEYVAACQGALFDRIEGAHEREGEEEAFDKVREGGGIEPVEMSLE